MKKLLESVLLTFTKDVDEYSQSLQLSDNYWLYVRNDKELDILNKLINDSFAVRGVHYEESYVDIKGLPYKISYNKYENVFIVNGISVDKTTMLDFVNSYGSLDEF